MEAATVKECPMGLRPTVWMKIRFSRGRLKRSRERERLSPLWMC